MPDYKSFHESTVRRILGDRDLVKLREDEQQMTFEQLAERWNERSEAVGRVDRWAVVDGCFVKVHWEGKTPEESNYCYDLVDGKLYHPLDNQ